jgi:glycosyltransferase involved in cell wall biosynthesis
MTILALLATTEVSGPCRGLFQLVKEVQKEEIRFLLGMFLVPPTRSTPAIDEAKRRGFQVAVLAQGRRYDPKLISQARAIVQSQGISLLQSHGYKPALLGWCLKHLTGLPWLAFCHGYTSENRRMTFYNRLDTWLLRRADRVIAMSRAMRAWLEVRGVPAHRIMVLHNAVDPADHNCEAEGLQFRELCGVGSEQLLVGVIGRFSPEKGQHQFLKAFRVVAETIPGARAVLVGDGQERATCEKAATAAGLTSRVTFAGYRPDMSEVYAALDLVVIPSLSEGLPNVLLEAMLHRKPVIATAVGGIPEAVPSDLSTLLVPPGDVGALARAMIRCLRDPALRLTYGEVGAEHIRRYFSPERRAAQMVPLYRMLADSRLSQGVGPRRH